MRARAVVLLVAACGGRTPSVAVPAVATAATIGGACRSDADCPPSYACDKDDPGGECNKKCQSSADCGQGGTCTPENECLASCQAQADCKRAGYECMGKQPSAYCDIPESTEKPAR